MHEEVERKPLGPRHSKKCRPMPAAQSRATWPYSSVLGPLISQEPTPPVELPTLTTSRQRSSSAPFERTTSRYSKAPRDCPDTVTQRLPAPSGRPGPYH